MSATRWIALLLVSVASFFVAGIAVILLLLAFGQSLLGWHDNIGPEVRWGIIAGFFAALSVAIHLHGRWSATTRPGNQS
ncbi:hypothetical protein [Lysobacter tyrosinilyticus]